MPPEGLLFGSGRDALAAELYGSVADLPLVCPHGHVDPWLLADPEATLGNPVDALVSGDHYVFRMLHSRGTPLEELGVRPNATSSSAADPRTVWQRFAEGFPLFAGTPTGLWLALELSDVFGIETPLNGSTAQLVYDELAEKLSLPEYSPRALFDRFRIEVLCTTDSILDELAAHEALHADGMGRTRPSDAACGPRHASGRRRLGGECRASCGAQRHGRRGLRIARRCAVGAAGGVQAPRRDGDRRQRHDPEGRVPAGGGGGFDRPAAACAGSRAPKTGRDSQPGWSSSSRS